MGACPIPLSAFVQQSAVLLLRDELTSSCRHLLCLTHRFANPASLNDATSWVFLNSPENVQHVCAANVKNYNMRYLPVSQRPVVVTQPAAVRPPLTTVCLHGLNRQAQQQHVATCKPNGAWAEADCPLDGIPCHTFQCIYPQKCQPDAALASVTCADRLVQLQASCQCVQCILTEGGLTRYMLLAAGHLQVRDP